MGWNHRTSPFGLVKRLGALALSAVLALGSSPVQAFASGSSSVESLAQATPDSTHQLLAQADEQSTIGVSCFIMGPGIPADEDVSGIVPYITVSYQAVPEGTTADVLTEALLNRLGVEHESSYGEWGYLLSSVTSPVTGESYAYNEKTGEYWQLVVNDIPSDVGASSVVLQDGDTVTWVYLDQYEGSTFSQTVWRGFTNPGNDSLLRLNTALGLTSSEWEADLKGDYLERHPDAPETVMGYVNVSDVTMVDYDLFVAVADELQLRDIAYGDLLRTAKLSAPIDYTARPLIINGKLIVPEHGGVLEAFSIAGSELTPLWRTEEVDPNHQNSGALVAYDGKVFAATFEYASDYSVSEGAVICVDIETGKQEWVALNEGSGYYWGGIAVASDYAVIGDDSGMLRAFALNASDVGDVGEEVSSLNLGAPVRSVPQTNALGDELYVVSTDGVLHKVSIAADGTMTETASVKFAESSTCTPSIVWNYAIVAGAGSGTVQTKVGDQVFSSATGRISMIKLSTMEERYYSETLENGDPIPGDIKSAPVINKNANSCNIYFTANGYPGALYCLSLDYDHAGAIPSRAVFIPSADKQNYCMSQVIVDAYGDLLYTNDSGTLFSVSRGGYHWEKDAGYWYLVNDHGSELINTAYNWQGGWYFFDETGKMLTGWYQDDEGYWCWLGGPDDGRLAEGWRLIDGSWYYFSASRDSLGVMQTGWLWVEGEWYWMGTSGAMHTGWQFIDGAWYYFDTNGHMLRNQVVDGYKLSASGAWIA